MSATVVQRTEIWLLSVNKACISPYTTRVINCLLYRNYTHNKTLKKTNPKTPTNLTFKSICVVVYVDGYIADIRKMKIEIKHSMTWEIVFVSICMVCFFQVFLTTSPWGHAEVVYLICISQEHPVKWYMKFVFRTCDVFN